MRNGYNSTFRARLLAGSALVAVSVAVPSAIAFAQATVDIDFASPAYMLNADVGNMLPQFSAAAVSGSTTGSTGSISLLSNSATDTTYTGAYLMEDNTLASEADGNTASGTVNLTFAPGVGTDTAAAGVYQDVTANVAAQVNTSDHDVEFANADATGAASLTGTLNVENNDLLATATGNTASSTIALASGVNLTGNGVQASTVTDSTYAAGVDSDNAADMLVAQAQRLSGAVTVGATTNDSNVLVDVEEISGATVTVSGSDITASATGSNLAGAITSADTTATIGASAAVVGVQNLDFAGPASDDVVARNVNSDIRLDFARSGDGVADNNTVTVSGNRINTVATGATADQSISLVANQITGNGTFASVGDGLGAGVQLGVLADALVASVQTMNATTTVLSDNNTNIITIDIADGSEPATNNSVSSTGNTMAASAVGLDATNAATLSAGSTLSAPGAVASVQLIEGVVRAYNSNEMDIYAHDDTQVSGSTYVLSSNTLGATAVGGQVNNDLVVANTDILSVAANTGSAAILADPASGTEPEAPTITAGYALANDQLLSDSDVLAIEASTGYSHVFTDDTGTSTITTDNNVMSSAATGATANNAISLSFNELSGAVVAGGDVVAAAANSQRVDGGSTVTASAYGDGSPVLVDVKEDAYAGTSISTSSNTVSASATANRSTGTTVTVDATNAVITGGVDGMARVDKTTGDVTGTAAFVAASSQELDASTVTAHQVNNVGTPTASNLIETSVGIDAGSITDSTIVSDANTLSVAATGNVAVTGVATGTNATAQIQASSAAVSYQDVANSAINAVLGSLGSDAQAAYTSTNAPTNAGFSAADVTEGAGSTFTNSTAGNLTFTFENANAQEIAILQGTFGVGNVSTAGTTTTVIWTSGLTVDLTTYNLNILAGEFVNILTMSQAAKAGTLNTAGVIIDAGAASTDMITDSTLSIDSNVIVGEVRGNVATNTVTATATTLTAFSAAATPVTNVVSTTIEADNADNALTNVQEIDGTSALTTTVAGTFALIDDDDSDRTGSSISVSGNLLQSYGTSNTASNTVTLTATNSSAGAALLNEQTMTSATGSGVVTVSDMDVATHAGMTSSDQALDNNTNQSVASANVETSTVTVAVTNADPVLPAAADGSFITSLLSADSILATEQAVTGTPTISAAATTDVFNRDLTDVTADQVITSTLSMSGNVTLAQATGNNSVTSMALGDAGTATYDASGALVGNQTVGDGAAVSAVTNVDVGTALRTADPTNATFQSSTISVDGNRADAVARGNVQSSALTVTAANVDAGGAGDADLADAGSTNAFGLFRYQTSGAAVSADSSAAVFSLSATGENSTSEASDGSTLSVSSNVSSATAVSNMGTNRVAIGSDGTASLLSTGALHNSQSASANGSTAATGGMSATATFGSGSVTNNIVVNGTTLNVDGNISSASATANSVTNSYTAVATNMTAGAADADASVALDTSGNDVTAANILSNDQKTLAGHTVAATNTANTVTATSATGTSTTSATAINASTVSVADNAFNAYATGNSAGNSAANSLSLGGTGTSLLSANAGVANRQTQAAAISASGSATVGVYGDGAGVGTALNASTVSVADNSVMVMARGNLANNSLSAGATSATGGDGADGSTNGVSTLSTFGLLNHQTNTGAVSAVSTNARFGVALNTVAPTYGTASSASTIGVSGNSVMAAAYGNVATNNNTLASLEGTNDDATIVTASYQMASGGAISASVTGGFAGVTANGPVGTSTVAVRGNTFTSKAVGNFATSVVTRR